MADRFDITSLADELEPVRPIRTAEGLALVAAAVIAAAALITAALGLRQDLMDMAPHPMFFLRAGTLLLLGSAATLATIRMARPAVGRAGDGWLWALGAAALFPLTALVMMAFEPMGQVAAEIRGDGMECLRMSMIPGLFVGTALVLWLRRGAPTALERAGWLTGIASGTLGALAYSLHCPFDSLYYIGLWYTLAVGLSAVAGRLIVPRLIRW
ncbi:MAG: NrsF family protein [Sphingomonadaceae bacterium]